MSFANTSQQNLSTFIIDFISNNMRRDVYALRI